MITTRLGKKDDIKWVSKLLVEGADNGHYLEYLKAQAEPLLRSIIDNGGVQMVKMRGSIQAPVFVNMCLTVAEIQGAPAAFLVCCTEPDEMEIHLAGTKKQFRRNSCFNKLVKEAIASVQSRQVFARCYKKSSWAIKGFESLGFKIVSNGDPIELRFVA